MSGASMLIKENLKISRIQQEILVGSLNVCSLIGSLASGKTSDTIGRRYTIVLAAATFLIGAIFMSLAHSFLFILTGRMIAGIGVGYALMISPLYTAELSPTTTRGFLTSLPEVFITLGILIGYVINYALTDLPINLGWRIMLAISALPAILIAFGVIFMPESPHWLVFKGRVSEAKRVLLSLSTTPEEAELRLQEIVTNKNDSAHGPGNWNGQGVWKELFLRPSKPIKRMLISAIGINFFMQASGNDAVIYYSPEVFKAAGIHGKKKLFGVNVIMGLSKSFFVFLSAIYLDKFGRRPLLLIGSFGMAVSLFGLGLGSKILEGSGKPVWAVVVCIVAVCADVSFFSIGLGPITWVYSSEIFPMRLRAQGSSIAISVNRLVSGVVSMTFLSISKKITFGGMFFVLAGILVVATGFFYVCMPETKGKTLEEMETLFVEDDDDNNNNSNEKQGSHDKGVEKGGV
jgi:sugar porter (SP) family MFS transporter